MRFLGDKVEVDRLEKPEFLTTLGRFNKTSLGHRFMTQTSVVIYTDLSGKVAQPDHPSADLKCPPRMDREQ
jgi:hypothetical protein